VTKKSESERRPQVLVVEDEESFVDALGVGLDREGFDVTVARDGHSSTRTTSTSSCWT
jgi:two-component system response regulator RegX3